MRNPWCSLAAALALASMLSAQAQDVAPRDAKQQASAARQRQNEVERGLQGVRQRLGLLPGKGGAVQDAELAKLYEASESARRAAEVKAQDVLKADPEGGKIVAQMDDARSKIAELQKQLGDAEKSLGPVRQRLGLGGPGKKGHDDTAPGAATENAEVKALRQTAAAARKALDDKILERVTADPEGAKLLAERQQIEAQAKASDARQPKSK